MSVFFLPDNSKSIFYFYEDEDKPNEIKTISYHLDSSGKIIDHKMHYHGFFANLRCNFVFYQRYKKHLFTLYKAPKVMS